MQRRGGGLAWALLLLALEPAPLSWCSGHQAQALATRTSHDVCGHLAPR